MKTLILLTAIITAAGFAPADTNTPTDAAALLRAADRARGNRGGITWHVALTAHEFDREITRSYRVKARHFDFLAEVTAPPRRRGNRLLMRDGSMWFYKPDLSKPVPISRRQKLAGNAANGDIAATNYAEDYDVLSITNRAVNGEACWEFKLKGRHRKVTYDRITYWVSKARGVGIKAEYATVSGKTIKSAEMEYAHELTDNTGTSSPFISRMIIRDLLVQDHFTVLEFSEPALMAIPESLFNLSTLRNQL